jgi:dihydrodipicolinate synthase/N-acetylneuraminate lyase
MVPWDKSYRFDEECFIKQLDHILEYGTDHVYIFGTAGEGYAVSDDDFKTITGVFNKQMNEAGANAMVGIISLSLRTVIERIEYCRDIGVKRFQISLPAWAACTQIEMMRFFEDTCGRFADCEFLHYNCPRSKRTVSVDEYIELSKLYPNLTATKNAVSSVRDMILLFEATPTMRHFLVELNFVSASLLGLDPGLLISMASVNFTTAHKFFSAAVEKDYERIREYTAQLSHIQKKLFEIVGSVSDVDGVYDKIFSKIADKNFPLRLQPPYSDGGDEKFRQFVDYLRNNHENWTR